MTENSTGVSAGRESGRDALAGRSPGIASSFRYVPPTLDDAVSGASPSVAAPSPDDLLGALDDTIVYRMIDDEDGASRFLYVSPTIGTVLGLDRAAVLRQPSLWYDLIDGDDLQALFEAKAAAREGNTVIERDVSMQAHGETRTFALRCRPRREGGRTTWDGTLRDVTRQRRHQRDAERLAAIVDATSDLVVTSWADGTVRYMNGAARRFFRMEDGIPPDTNVRSFRPKRLESFYRSAVVPMMRQAGIWSGETTIIDRDGHERPVSQVMIRHSRTDGTAERYSTILRDASERASERNAFRQEREELTEANERIEVTLGEVNHRVKNLFALVPAIVQLSARGKSSVNEVVDAVRDRVGALARSHTLTINAFSQAGGVDVRALAEAVLEPYRDREDAFALKGASVRLSSRDANAMALVLHELATNAVKHGSLSEPSGTVVIEWETVERDATRPHIFVRWTEAHGPVVVAPMDAEGFGTQLLDRLVNAQGGTLAREWRPQGLAVTLDLPLY